MSPNKKKTLELATAALVGSAVGALAISFAKSDAPEKIADSFDEVKSKVMDRFEEIKANVKNAQGKSKDVLKNELQKIRSELEKAEKLLDEE